MKEPVSPGQCLHLMANEVFLSGDFEPEKGRLFFNRGHPVFVVAVILDRLVETYKPNTRVDSAMVMVDGSLGWVPCTWLGVMEQGS